MRMQAGKVKGITVRVTDPRVQEWLEETVKSEYVSHNALLNKILHQAMNSANAKMAANQNLAA